MEITPSAHEETTFEWSLEERQIWPDGGDGLSMVQATGRARADPGAGKRPALEGQRGGPRSGRWQDPRRLEWDGAGPGRGGGLERTRAAPGGTGEPWQRSGLDRQTPGLLMEKAAHSRD